MLFTEIVIVITNLDFIMCNNYYYTIWLFFTSVIICIFLKQRAYISTKDVNFVEFYRFICGICGLKCGNVLIKLNKKNNLSINYQLSMLMIPLRIAYLVNSTVLCLPSLSIKWVLWVSTVFTLIYSSLAIPLFE